MKTRIAIDRVQAAQDDMRTRLEMSTAEIGLAVRTTNCLEERGVFTVHDLLNCTREDLLSISNFGEKTLEEVYKALEGVGFFRPSRRPNDAEAGQEMTDRQIERHAK
ncbi:MAG: DNA-directed RNA polymerase subunit alpha C-terminal domain-containing protein [Lacipirellulaceae bacterium]